MAAISHDVAALLDAVTLTAQRSVDAAVTATVTVVTDDVATTASATSDWAEPLDAVQYSIGGGPCFDAAVGGETRQIRDAALDQRWPRFASASLERGALSTLSVPIPVDDEGMVGSLNVFATTANAFSASDRANLTQLAGTAAVALNTVGIGIGPARVRTLVDQAKGIVMNAEHCTPAEALDSLNRRVQVSGLTLRQVASDLVASARPST